MSISTSGRARRSFIIGSRLWPPATSRASGPCRSSSASAWSTLVARSYSNGAGVCTVPPIVVTARPDVPRPHRRRTPPPGRGRPKRSLIPEMAHRSMPARPSSYEWCVTLTQLEAFVLVARLGSVKAAAKVLGVSEPAVSGALAALRQHLGDPLVTAHAHTAWSSRARRAAARRRSPRRWSTSPSRPRPPSATPRAPRELLAGRRHEHGRRVRGAPLSQASPPGRRSVEATVGLATAEEMPALLHERLADVGLGPRLSGERGRHPANRSCATGSSWWPARRIRWPEGRSRCRGACSPTTTGSSVRRRPTRSERRGQLLRRLRVPDHRVRVFPSEAAAWAAAADGRRGRAGGRPPRHAGDRARRARSAPGRRHAGRPALVREHARSRPAVAGHDARCAGSSPRPTRCR